MFGAFEMLASAAASLAGGLTSYALGNSASRDAVDESISGSQTLSRWNALELPWLQMRGLEKAGLNPILTAGNLGSAAAQVQAPINPNSSSIGESISGLPNQLMSLSQGAANIGQIKANTMATRANVQMGQQRLALDSARAQADIAKVQQEKLESAARTLQLLSRDEKGDYWFVRLNKARDELLKQQAEAAKASARRSNRNTTIKFGPFGNIQYDSLWPIFSAWRNMFNLGSHLSGSDSGSSSDGNSNSAKVEQDIKNNYGEKKTNDVRTHSQKERYWRWIYKGFAPSDGGMF